jgi:hypothetical protein
MDARGTGKQNTGSIYFPLTAFLLACQDDEVTCTFAEIEQILGRPLPRFAFTSTWWGGRLKHGYPRPWKNAGWRIKRVEVRQRWVTFARKQPDSPAAPA